MAKKTEKHLMIDVVPAERSYPGSLQWVLERLEDAIVKVVQRGRCFSVELFSKSDGRRLCVLAQQEALGCFSWWDSDISAGCCPDSLRLFDGLFVSQKAADVLRELAEQAKDYLIELRDADVDYDFGVELVVKK